jgi:hypothetical protein
MQYTLYLGINKIERYLYKMVWIKGYIKWVNESDVWSTIGIDDEDENARKIRNIIQASKSNDPEKRLKAIRSILTPAAVLIKLSDDPDQFVKITVAKHKNTPSKTLDKLSKSDDVLILIAVANNVKTSPRTLAYLSRGDSKSFLHHEVRSAVAKNPKTSLETIIKLSRDKDETIRNIAEIRLNEIKAIAQQKGEESKLAKIEELESMSDLGIHGDYDGLNLDDLDI